MNILGISAFYHDSAACLVRDGKIIGAAQEERFTRKKHDAEFPINAIRACVTQAGLAGARDVDLVAFYEKPFLKCERLFSTYLACAPRGLLYSAFTYYVGFRVNSGEYKVMGLAPYGEPEFEQLILDELVDLKPDGSFHLNLDYFDFVTGLRMTNHKFDRLFGGPPRRPESELTQRHMNVARSLQAVTEQIMLRMARHARELTGLDKLCLAGGVALNCVGNGRILRDGPFEKIWVQPAAGDAG